MRAFIIFTVFTICECAAPTVWTEPPITAAANGSAAIASTVAENTAPGPLGVTIAATGASAYAITGQPTPGMFTIADTGVLTLATGNTLDFETAATYLLTIEGGDSAGASGTITATLSITDVNEAPTFPSATVSASVVTGAAAGTTITTVTASDQDTKDTLTYAIFAGNTPADLEISSTTGAITVASGKTLDMATTASYTLTVTGADAALTATTTVSITVAASSAVVAALTGSLATLSFMFSFLLV